MLVATGFGVGFAPKAPGTFGALLGVALWWWVIADLPAWAGALVVVALAVAATASVARTCRVRALGDEPAIVLDEVVGQCIALTLAPRTWWAALLGFALFRIFDIAKPGPVRWADRQVKGGFGVMLDDVIAGLLALIVLQVSVWAVGCLVVGADG